MNLSVTLVGGFLGSGKTSLLHHFLSEHATVPITVLVESNGAVNSDARAIRGLCGAMRRAQDKVREFSSDEEMVEVLRDLAGDEGLEHLLIEISGTTNPARLARLLQSEAGNFTMQLRQIICVVDALDFYQGTIIPSQRNAAGIFSDFQREQIESATLLVLNKCDLVSEAERAACVETLHRINPEASFFETAYGELPGEVWTRSASIQELGFALEQRLPSEATDQPINVELGSMLYRAYRPFHPGRFWDWFESEHPGLFRVKGLIWLATRNLLVGGISRTRWQNSCGGAGIWWAALPREEWPSEPEALMRMQETWREPHGDRRQEFTMVGEAAALPKIAQQLEQCLLSDEEYSRPAREWLNLPDPFPAWDME